MPDVRMKRNQRWLSIAAGALLLLGIVGNASVMQPAVGQTPEAGQPEAGQPLRIATRLVKPDAFQENGQLTGFSVDLGRSILEQLQRQAVVQTYADVPEMLTAIQTGQADLGIAAIALTQQRDQTFDFSHPILVEGLQIMTLTGDEQSQQAGGFWQYFVDPKLLRLFGTIALLMLIPIHVVWYFERRNPDNGIVSSLSYIPGIFQALWWTLLALLGQADNMPKGPIGRAVALFWLLVGIIFVTYFTAIITADITTQELQGNIQTLNDLDNRPVGIITGTQAKDALYAQNTSQLIEFPQLEQAYEALQQQEIDAIVAPRPLLLYFATHTGQGKVQVVGTPFREQFYGIVMPKDNPYRRPVNQAILTLKENGTYQKIYRRWFGSNPLEDATARSD